MRWLSRSLIFVTVLATIGCEAEPGGGAASGVGGDPKLIQLLPGEFMEHAQSLGVDCNVCAQNRAEQQHGQLSDYSFSVNGKRFAATVFAFEGEIPKSKLDSGALYNGHLALIVESDDDPGIAELKEAFKSFKE